MNTNTAAVLEAVQGGHIVLQRVDIAASIKDLLAEVTVTQAYRNEESATIEAVYTFALPMEAVLLGFEAKIGERKHTGVVVEKSESERRYEDAITDGDAAVLLQQAGAGLYTASVGNLMPSETATIRFHYAMLLRWNGDRVRFAMPTTIAPRYGDPASAGLAPHQVPEYAFDAERAFSLMVAVRGLLKDARFNSPSHSVSVATDAEMTIIALAGTPVMDRDFVLDARSSQPEAAGALVAKDLDGWVALASFRPDIPQEASVQRRSVMIVVDCSGSMSGDSIAQARVALERILDGLRASDLFEIIAFGSSQRALFGRETPVSETTLAHARRFVRALDADMGGTEIGAAIDAAFKLPAETDLPRDLLLITDGEVWNNSEAIALAKRSRHRIFTVGVGSAVAEAFVRDLAEATGGACELVTPREDMAERIHRHFQRMYAPRAKSAVVRWPARSVTSLPQSIEAVYSGDTVHLFAWFTEKPEGAVSLDVTLTNDRVVSDEAKILPFEDALVDTNSPNDASPATLARIAAARRLYEIEDDKAGSELAVRYQIMSQWTNYLVVHVREEAEKAKDLPKIVKVPQVLAAGWHGMGTVLTEQKLALRVESCHDASFRLEEPVFEWCSISPEAYSQPKRMADDTSAIGPAELVALLNAHDMSSPPTLNDLQVWGAPEATLVALRSLVDQGENEAIVVATFLYLLAGSEAGNALNREVRRRILKAYKTATPHQAVIDAVTCAFDGWQS